MPKNRFLDDNIDVVPSNEENTNVLPNESPMEVEPIPSPEVVIDDTNNSATPEYQDTQSTIDIKQDYMKIVEEYKKNKDIISSRKEDLNNILDDTYGKNKVPMFIMVKDRETGEITVEPKDPKLSIPKEESKKNVNTDNVECIKEMLEKTNKDLIKASIEAKIYIELCNSETNPDKKEMYKQKINIFKNEVAHQQNRKSILERML